MKYKENMGISQQNQDNHWMKIAIEMGQEALDQGEFPVGAIIVHQGKIVGSARRHNSKGTQENELDHAEILAIRDWLSRGAPGRGKAICYSTLEPCLMCLGALIINGIGAIRFSYEDVMGGACGIDFNAPFSAAAMRYGPGQGAISATTIHFPSREFHLFRGFADRIRGGILRRQGLKLFREFFSRHDNHYLKDTLLARYTLAQEE